MYWETIYKNKTASFQKEAMRTQVALWFFYEVKLYAGKCLCVWKSKMPQHTSWEKSTALKNCDQIEIIGFYWICL